MMTELAGADRCIGTRTGPIKVGKTRKFELELMHNIDALALLPVVLYWLHLIIYTNRSL